MKDDERYQERLKELLPLIRFLQGAVEILGRDKARELAAAAFEKYARDRFVEPYRDIPPAERWIVFREDIINNADDYQYSLEEYTDNLVRIKYLRCIFLEIFREYGLEDFVPLYCQTDFFTCREIDPGIILTRTRTLAEGATHCDHCWKFQPGRS